MAAKKQRPAGGTILHVKNMVCNRCIKVVREELEKLDHHVLSIELGEVRIAGEPEKGAIGIIRTMLMENGFELIEDQRIRTIERIKQVVLELVRRDAEQNPVLLKQSEYIARAVGRDYHSLSTLFSSMENITIERYVILQRIERVKELLKYGEMTLSEISYTLGYSSLQHLSNQFKSVTGMTPSEFKKMLENTRRPLDKVV
jgi:AraC-like DNA-binding protein